MSSFFRPWLSLLLCLAWHTASAAPGPDAAEVARHPTWQRLLHIAPGASRSEVRSPDFFLATDHPGEALPELQAALTAHAQPWGDRPDDHPRCRFPARYHYLASQGLLPDWREREPRCRKLEQWARLDELRSASLLMVSGYFGNPASTFGHTLLRLNTSEPDSSNSLLDRSFNFGALVPEGEPMLRYIWRGLTGGYIAGFADRAFYAHDRVYAHEERRDFWDYELRLTPGQLRLLALHLFEISGRGFDYYFLTQNCAYRLAELIELVTGETLTQRSRVWYAPVELFHRLQEADRRPGGGLIGTVRYMASAESLLRERLQQLPAADRALALQAMQSPTGELPAAVQALPPERQADIVETLLAEVQQRLIAEKSEPQAATRERQAELLRRRLQLPPAATPLAPPPPKPSIAEGAAPARLGLGWRSTAARDTPVLRAAAFDYHALAGKGLAGGELVVLDGELALRGRPQLIQLDLVRVRKLETEALAVSGWAWSWQTQIGLGREQHLGRMDPDGQRRLRPRASFAAGQAAALGSGLGQAYALLGAEVLGDPGVLALQPRLGWVTEHGPWGLATEWSLRAEGQAGPARSFWRATAVWRQAPWQLRLVASREPVTTLRLDLTFAL